MASRKHLRPAKLKALFAALAVAVQLSACAAPGGVYDMMRDPTAGPVRASVDGGVLQGVATRGGKAWLGVRYAAPPVGALRWRAPRPATPWTGARPSLRLGADCVQNLSPGSLLGKPGGLFVRGSEDCLFLNIYTPSNAEPGPTWPVMVWLHGGGFSAGTAGNLDPSLLVQKQGVIVVTLNYRLGAFGFLALPALSAEDPAVGSGDYGLLDQQAALGWVRDNIAAFGGDPHRVTLFGESAGGFSVCHQLAAPGAVGLFAGAIIESGACTGPAQNVPATVAEPAGQRTARDLGCADSASILACLRAARPEVIARTVSHRRGALGPNSWGPVVATPVLPDPMGEAFANGRFAHVPVMLGVNRNEGALFAYLQKLDGRLWSEASYRAILAGAYGKAAKAVEGRYPASSFGSPALAYAALVTDETFVCPALETAGLLRTWSPVWLYEFADERPPTALLRLPGMPSLGAYHASEIAYVTQRPWILADPARFDSAQRALSDEIQGAWGRFARLGNPASPGSRRPWPSYPSARAFRTANDDDPPLATRDHNCDFWRRLAATP